MNEESMDMILEEVWEDAEVGAAAADEFEPAEEGREPAPEETGPGEADKDDGTGMDTPAGEQAQEEQTAADMPKQLPEVPKGVDGQEHPLLKRARENAQRQDMERFLRAYPEVKAECIPKSVWTQVAQGIPLVSAYAMHENQQLKIQLAAERQNRDNRERTPGGLGANVGSELDELDRMWNEDD